MKAPWAENLKNCRKFSAYLVDAITPASSNKQNIATMKCRQRHRMRTLTHRKVWGSFIAVCNVAPLLCFFVRSKSPDMISLGANHSTFVYLFAPKVRLSKVCKTQNSMNNWILNLLAYRRPSLFTPHCPSPCYSTSSSASTYLCLRLKFWLRSLERCSVSISWYIPQIRDWNT
jgi:hypothetical protein